MTSSFIGSFLLSKCRFSSRFVLPQIRPFTAIAGQQNRVGGGGAGLAARRQRSLLFLAATTTGVAFSAANTTSMSNDDDDDNNHFPCDALETDNYNGILLKVDKAADDERFQSPDRFQSILEASLGQWKEEGKRGIWVYLPTRMAHLVPVCVANGFEFHYAKKGSLVLTHWLPETESRLPLGPTHQVGVGCLITRGDEMLVVQETTGPAARYKLWKMPTGLLDPGENINEAAVRELKEETGLDGSLYKILTFRQAHPLVGKSTSSGASGGSDLFFVCWMKLDDEGQEFVKQEEEIADIRWMPIREFADQELWQKSPVYQEMNEAMIRAVEADQGGMQEVTLPVGFRPGVNTIYIPAKM